MEKSFKRKMLTVAGVHLVLSVIFGLQTGGGFSRSYKNPILFRAWEDFWVTACLIMQPQFLIVKYPESFTAITGVLSFSYVWFDLFLFVVSVPLWSLCFGWLYTKAVDRLNRFPVLGHKLF